MNKRNLAADILGVLVALLFAYLCTKIDARPGDPIDTTEVIRTALFIGFVAVAIGCGKLGVVDFAKLLRQSAMEANHG